jgi:TatD DNase family protein
MLVDTHCHLDLDAFDGDRDAVIDRAVAAGVGRIIVPAIDLPGCRRVLRMAESYPMVFAAVGVHPNASADWATDWLNELRDLAGHPKVVAVGEIGLDYYRDRSPHDMQQRALRAQLELAAELGLPVILHNRQAETDLLDLLAEVPGRGVLHSFSAGPAAAQRALELGYHLGFNGPITFKKADETRRVAAGVPLERLLVETDAPFLAPEAYRGRRNEPAYVVSVAAKVAELHGKTVGEVGRQTTANAALLFGRKLVAVEEGADAFA